MKLISASAKIERSTPKALKAIEKAARTCYQSQDSKKKTTTGQFVRNIVSRRHTAMLEFADATVRFTVDRGVSHELVRHRLASFAQESTRYCCYKGGVTFIMPPWSMELHEKRVFLVSLKHAEIGYMRLLERGWSAQQARAVLPNAVKTEVVVKANFREWRHIFSLRDDLAAHPQMREVMEPLHAEFKRRWPEVFCD